MANQSSRRLVLDACIASSGEACPVRTGLRRGWGRRLRWLLLRSPPLRWVFGSLCDMRGKVGRTKWTAPEDDCSPSQKSRSKGAVPGAPKRGEAAPEEVWTTGAGRRDRPEAYGGRGTVAVAAASLQKKASIAHAINTHSE